MLLGAVDLGSNSFRVVIARVEGERIVPQSYWKETIRLAGGFDENGALTPEAQARALAALARFRERLSGIPPERVRAVGTQAMRAATNADEFLLKAQEALGYRIDILSGHEEARLVFKGCAQTLPPSDKRRLVIDIGGASTEFIIGTGTEPLKCESYKIGCVNTSIRLFPDGKFSAKAFDRAVVACCADLEDSIRAFGRPNYDEAYGSAGTFGAVSGICAALGWSDGEVRPEHLEKLRRMLLEMHDASHVRFEGLKEDRREVIAGGLAVLLACYRTLGIESMRPAQGALRVGLLHDLWGRVEHRDTRDVTIAEVARAGRIDAEQAKNVAETALKLYRALRPEATPEDEKMLVWAATLHEVGMTINTSRYHRHGEYIVRNTDMPGFSRRDQDVMAKLILAQRGNLKKVQPELDQSVSAAAVLALRLAVIFMHARSTPSLPVFAFERTEGALRLKMDAVWLSTHPLTDHLLQEESAYWARIGRQVLMERFG